MRTRVWCRNGAPDGESLSRCAGRTCGRWPAEKGLGLEEAGRQVRYAFFEELAAIREPCRIATAHTAGDNLETVLLHIIRGSALKGLSGIAPVAGGSSGR